MFKKRKLGSHHWDAVHEKLRGEKRDTVVCSETSYSLCPSSLGGGCCPSDRSCGLNSCFATATSTNTGCTSSYTTCGIVEGGGCCPSGYACQRNGCIAPTDSSVIQLCSHNSYLCPSSMSFGCCRSGLSCGLSTCYETTSTTTVSFTLYLTSTYSNSAVTTIAAVIETAYNPPTPTSDPTTALPTPIAKLSAETISPSASTTTSTPSSGLSAKELGGIVGACVFLLLALLLATFLILRRLNLTIRLTKDGPATTNRPGPLPSTSTNALRNLSIGIDSFQQIPSSRTDTQSHQSRKNQTTPSELSDNTPLTGHWGHHPNIRSSRVPPLVAFSPLHWPARVTARPGHTDGSSTATAQYRSLPSSDTSQHWRSDSEGSQIQSISQPLTATMHTYTAELQSPDPPQGYFDIPILQTTYGITANMDPDLRDQNLRFGHRANMNQGSDARPSIEEGKGGHGRQWSDVSELSNGTEITNESYELDDTSHKSSYGNKHGYGSLCSSAEYGDKRCLRDGLKNKVQDWVGMTGLGRKSSGRSIGGASLRDLKSANISPTMSSPSPTSSPAFGSHDQEQWPGSAERPLRSFSRFGGDKGRLEAIREALRESGTTINSHAKSDTCAGEVSESRAQIARMELRRVDSDMSDLTMLGKGKVDGDGGVDVGVNKLLN